MESGVLVEETGKIGRGQVWKEGRKEGREGGRREGKKEGGKGGGKDGREKGREGGRKEGQTVALPQLTLRENEKRAREPRRLSLPGGGCPGPAATVLTFCHGLDVIQHRDHSRLEVFENSASQQQLNIYIPRSIRDSEGGVSFFSLLLPLSLFPMPISLPGLVSPDVKSHFSLHAPHGRGLSCGDFLAPFQALTPAAPPVKT